MDERGNIAVAMAVLIIAFLSSITLTEVALKDVLACRIQQDGLQETHLLRYEASRGTMACQITDYSEAGFTLPLQQFEMLGSDSRTTYFMKTKVEQSNVTTGGGYYMTNGYTVKSLVTAKRGGGNGIFWSQNYSTVRKYAEKDVRRSTFAGYHYFTNTEVSEDVGMPGDDGRIVFAGNDVIYGKVHSNSDIWIANQGGGINGGWPLFYAPVSTCGIIRCVSGTIPYQTVFHNHYYEHVAELEFPSVANAVQAGPHVGLPYDVNTILRVHISGNQAQSWIGQIVPATQRESIDCYAQYPPPTGPELYWYYLSPNDTVWTPGPMLSVSNNSIYCECKLWIDGTFSGRQTWGCRDTLFLVGNIELSGTPLGTSPDGNGNASFGNPYDFVGLISEQRIYLKYGLNDPLYDGRRHPTSGPDTGGVWIYAALCALGDGNGDPHKDGIFSFEYQAPHYSTPDIRLNDINYTKIDLHKRRFPPTNAYPWPGTIDFPWYNPLWPEADPYLERGSIHLYGSIAQRRRGVVHRPLYDYGHHDGTWNLDQHKWGSTSDGMNYPGASGTGVGYKKDYHFDNRFSFTQPPNFPEIHVRAGLTPFESESWRFKKPPANF